MQKIKSKKCFYDGVMFRSITEAKWCQLISNLGFDLHYEPKAFKTSIGWYVPDFLVGDLWVEVKGEKPTSDEIRKLSDVTVQTGKHGIIVSGYPKYYDGCDPHFANSSISLVIKGDVITIPFDLFYKEVIKGNPDNSFYGYAIATMFPPSTDMITNLAMKRFDCDSLKPSNAKIKAKHRLNKLNHGVLKVINSTRLLINGE